MIGWLFHNKQKGMLLIMKNHMNWMGPTSMLTISYAFHDILLNQLIKWLLAFESMLVSTFHVSSKDEVARCCKISVTKCYHLCPEAYPVLMNKAFFRSMSSNSDYKISPIISRYRNPFAEIVDKKKIGVDRTVGLIGLRG